MASQLEQAVTKVLLLYFSIHFSASSSGESVWQGDGVGPKPRRGCPKQTSRRLPRQVHHGHPPEHHQQRWKVGVISFIHVWCVGGGGVSSCSLSSPQDPGVRL